MERNYQYQYNKNQLQYHHQKILLHQIQNIQATQKITLYPLNMMYNVYYNHKHLNFLIVVRLAAPAERWGGFGTCAQSGQHGDRRTQAVPGHSPSPTTIGSRPDPADVRSKRTTRNGGPEPAKRATNPRRYSRNGIPSARKVPRSGPTSQPKGRFDPFDSDRLPPDSRVPSYLAPSLMPQLHDAGEQEAGGRVLGVHW